VRQGFEEIQRAGGAALAVASAPPSALAAFLARDPLPFPLVSDPGRRAYEAFGLERTTWANVLRPRALAGYLGLLLRGWGPRRPHPDEDVLQLGGDFVLDAEGRLAFAYRSRDPTDRPPIARLVQAVREARVPAA
jgi:hypothetical protein